MSFFEIVGMVVTGVVGLGLAALIVILIKDFFGYQKGARNTRDYGYSGEDRSEWYWTKYGVKTWLRSFRRGGGWHFETAEPEDDNYDLRVYEDGRIVRERSRYVG